MAKYNPTNATQRRKERGKPGKVRAATRGRSTITRRIPRGIEPPPPPPPPLPGPATVPINPVMLCNIAKSDAQHDFKTSVNPDLLNSTLPNIGEISCEAMSENDTLANIGITNVGANFIVTETQYTAPYEHEIVTYDNLDSRLGGLFPSELGFIVDAYTGRFRDFCMKLKDGSPRTNPGLTYYWIETPETVYDPAPKTRANTTTGIEIAGPNLIFATEVYEHTYKHEENAISHPIIHKSYDYPSGTPLDLSSADDRQRLFYSNYTFAQFSTTNNESITVLSDNTMDIPINIIVNEKVAEIKQKNMDSTVFLNLQNTAHRDNINRILEISLSNPTAKLYNDLVKIKYKYPLKRLGDQGQALACLRPLFVKLHDTDTIKTFNKNICFVTHDLIALTSAIVYQVPAVIFCRQDGNFEVFINKMYRTPEQLLSNAKSKYSDIYNLYSTNIALHDTRIRDYTHIETHIYRLIDECITKYQTLLNYNHTLQFQPNYVANMNAEYIKFFRELYNYRCDILYYYSKISTIKPLHDFPTIDTINTSDINTINTHYARLMREYSNLNAQLLHIKYILDKYLISPDGTTITRIEGAPSDTITMSKINELQLFTATTSAVSERTANSILADLAGIEFIHTYANALYYNMPTPDTFLKFMDVFRTIINIINTGPLFSPSVKALGQILPTRIIDIESYKTYKRLNPSYTLVGGRIYGGNITHQITVAKVDIFNNEITALIKYLEWLKVYAINKLTYNSDSITRSIDISTINTIARDGTQLTLNDGSIVPVDGSVQIICNYDLPLPYFIDDPMKFLIDIYAPAKIIYNTIITHYNNNNLEALRSLIVHIDLFSHPPAPAPVALWMPNSTGINKTKRNRGRLNSRRGSRNGPRNGPREDPYNTPPPGGYGRPINRGRSRSRERRNNRTRRIPYGNGKSRDIPKGENRYWRLNPGAAPPPTIYSNGRPPGSEVF
jgi:hypothetical protein